MREPSFSNGRQANGQDPFEEKLGRLSKKPGVKASIVIDRATGAILKRSGQVNALQTTKSRTTSTATTYSTENIEPEEEESRGVEQFANMVWNFVNNSGSFVQELDSEVGSSATVVSARSRKADFSTG